MNAVRTALSIFVVLSLALACRDPARDSLASPADPPVTVTPPAPPASSAPDALSAPLPEQDDSRHDPWAILRERMVSDQLEGRDITDPAVLAAMRKVPRHAFVPIGYRQYAYRDHPLPIGQEQTISQPYIVALMTQLAEIRPGARVLEVGTGSGYQAAVLAEMGATVYTIEIVPELGRAAARELERNGYTVEVRIGDGYQGWPEHAPFDAILVTAAPDHVPQPLLDQLAVGGRMVIPVGVGVQELKLIVRGEGGVVETSVLPVRFVPMTGEGVE